MVGRGHGISKMTDYHNQRNHHDLKRRNLAVNDEDIYSDDNSMD